MHTGQRWPAISSENDWTRYRAEQAATDASLALRAAERATFSLDRLDKRVTTLETKAQRFERWAAYGLILLLLAAQAGPEVVLKVALKMLGGI